MSSEINEHVSITTTENSVGITFAGFGTQAIVSCNATFPERSRSYSDLPEMVTDGFASKTPEYRAAQKAFAQKPRPKTVKIVKALGKPTLLFRYDVLSVVEGVTYTAKLKGSLSTITDTTCSYTTKADQTFVDGDVSVATNLITEVAHGMTSGDGPHRVSNAGGGLPGGLVADTNYWIHVPTGNANAYGFATSEANALAGTLVDITTAAGGGTHTLRRNQNDVIIAQLVDKINAIAGKNFTASQTVGAGETDYMLVTGDAAGVWFSLEIGSLAYEKIECTHAEPATTLATDLDAIQTADGDWYGFSYLYPSDACVKACAAWAEAKTKLYIQSMSDSTLVTGGDGTGDTGSDLKALNYARTALIYHPDPSSFIASAWMGRVLPTEPGRATWKFKNLKGVIAATLTTTQRTNARAKNLNAYTLVGARATTWEGKTVDGDFIDVTRNIDWLDDRMQKRVYNALEVNDIVPFTDEGIQIIRNEMEATIDEAVERKILAGGDEYPVITVPKALAVDAVNRGNRNLPDMNWSGRLSGAVHKVSVNGNVTV